MSWSPAAGVVPLLESASQNIIQPPMISSRLQILKSGPISCTFASSASKSCLTSAHSSVAWAVHLSLYNYLWCLLPECRTRYEWIVREGFAGSQVEHPILSECAMLHAGPGSRWWTPDPCVANAKAQARQARDLSVSVVAFTHCSFAYMSFVDKRYHETTQVDSSPI